MLIFYFALAALSVAFYPDLAREVRRHIRAQRRRHRRALRAYS